MEFTFSSERKLVFTVSAGGRNLLVEFSDRNSGGRSSFVTTDTRVAQAIRRTSLSRRGVIVETTKEQERHARTVPVRPNRPTTPNDPATLPENASTAKPAADSGPSVRTYDNFTLAREAVVKEFGVRKSEVRNPTALARFAQEKGFTISYRTE